MLSLSEAQQAIFERLVRARAVETLPLAQAVGRYTAEAVCAHVDNPAFDNASMDGYALRYADLAAAARALPIVGESRCGHAPGALQPGSAMRIFTGAPLPAGADTVAPQEDVRVDEGRACFAGDPKPGENVRRHGEDFRAGEALYPRGRRLRPYDIAVLAAAGVARIAVFVAPRALVFANGDELVAPGRALQAGQIYESNRLASLQQLEALGVRVDDGGTVPDQPDALRALLQAAGDYDFVISSGGASVGDYDWIKQVLAGIGTVEMWKARIKPGKPIAFGRIGERTHLFALPGNPVSSLVTFKLFVEPALAVWHHGVSVPLELPAIAANRFRRRPGRMEFLRARLFNDGGVFQAEALPGQGSHMIGTLRDTNGLIRIDEQSTGFEVGERLTVLPLRLDLA